MSQSYYDILLQKSFAESTPFCKSCNTADYVIEDHHEGTMVCSGCGQVILNRIISTEKEWREFEDEDTTHRQRAGGPASVDEILIGNGSLSTSFGEVKPSSSGAQAGKESKKGLAKTQNIADKQNKDEEYLRETFQKINEMCDRLEINERCSTRIKQFYRELYEYKRGLKGKKQEPILGACIYKALQVEGYPRAMKEILVATHSKKKLVNQYITQLNRALQQSGTLSKIDSNSGTASSSSAAASQSNARSFCHKYINQLGLPYWLQIKIEETADNVTANDICMGRSPVTIAAACIVLVSHEFAQNEYQKVTCKSVEDIMGTTENTIRKALKELETKKQLILPNS